MIYARHLSKFNKLVFFQALQRIRKTTDNVSKLKEIFEKLQQQDDVGKDELGANLWKKWRVYDNKTAKSGKGKVIKYFFNILNSGLTLPQTFSEEPKQSSKLTKSTT